MSYAADSDRFWTGSGAGDAAGCRDGKTPGHTRRTQRAIANGSNGANGNHRTLAEHGGEDCDAMGTLSSSVEKRGHVGNGRQTAGVGRHDDGSRIGRPDVSDKSGFMTKASAFAWMAGLFAIVAAAARIIGGLIIKIMAVAI
jgi:hypothetical protein